MTVRAGWSIVPLEALPAGDAFLSPVEREIAACMPVEKRRRDFLLGRFAAKRTLAAWTGQRWDPAALSLLPTALGAPRVHLDGEPLPFTLSLSHSGGRALVVVGEEPLGCDLEQVEHRPELAADFFSAAEQARLRGCPADQVALLGTLTWSAKEAALKLFGVGLRQDTRGLETVLAAPRGEEWSPFAVHDAGGRRASGLYATEGGFVRCVAAAEALGPWALTRL